MNVLYSSKITKIIFFRSAFHRPWISAVLFIIDVQYWEVEGGLIRLFVSWSKGYGIYGWYSRFDAFSAQGYTRKHTFTPPLRAALHLAAVSFKLKTNLTGSTWGRNPCAYVGAAFFVSLDYSFFFFFTFFFFFFLLPSGSLPRIKKKLCVFVTSRQLKKTRHGFKSGCPLVLGSRIGSRRQGAVRQGAQEGLPVLVVYAYFCTHTGNVQRRSKVFGWSGIKCGIKCFRNGIRNVFDKRFWPWLCIRMYA